METIELQPVSGSVEQENFYLIDFSKMEKVEDLVVVLASMGFMISNKNPNYEQVKPFLNPTPVPIKR